MSVKAHKGRTGIPVNASQQLIIVAVELSRELARDIRSKAKDQLLPETFLDFRCERYTLGERSMFATAELRRQSVIGASDQG